jgi:hypothetical protein
LELTVTLEPDTLVEARELEREMKRKKNRALIFHLSNPQREIIQIHFSICLFEAASYMVSGL